MTTDKTRAWFPRLKRLKSGESGIAAVEFALLAPMMIGVYLGLAELSMAMTVDRQVAHSASVMGDMVTQVTEVDAEDMADVMAASMIVSRVRDRTKLVMHVESFEMDDDGNITSLGSAVYNSARKSDLETVDPATLGPELLSPNSGVVIARVAYEHNALGLIRVDGSERAYLPTSITLRETFMLKPRRSFTVEIGEDAQEITCTGSGKNTTCTDPGASNTST